MKTLVIYDLEGNIFFQAQGSIREPQGGLLFIWVEIPDGKILKGIDTSVTPNIPIYEDLPKSEIDLLKEQVAALNIALAEVLGV